MKSVIPMIVVFVFVFAAVFDGDAMGQSEPRAANPWLSVADELPPLPQDVDVELVVDRAKIETYEPVIARISLTNRDEKPLSLKVRQDGAPRAVASLVAHGNDPFFRHHQWVRTSGPSSRRITLAPGESTDGEILILFGGPPTGGPFAEAGEYRVKFACQPDGRFAPVYTNVIELTVSPDVRGNAAFLDELSELVYSHYGWDRESVIRGNGAEYIPGMEILKKVIKVRNPHLVDPERSPADKREAALVHALADLLDRHPDSSYSGYIARFLGLVHIKTFEHVVSHGHLERWTQENLTEELQVVYDRAARAREKALRYLTMASGHNLWPRTTAYFELARLYGMSEQWDKVQECTAKLRTIGASNGIEIADRVEREIARYRKKLERRTPRDN